MQLNVSFINSNLKYETSIQFTNIYLYGYNIQEPIRIIFL